jgi:hypothetical protein
MLGPTRDSCMNASCELDPQSATSELSLPKEPVFIYFKYLIKNSVALSPRASYTDWATATCPRNLVPAFVDRGVSRGQRGGSPTVVNLSFPDRSGYFPFK